MAFSSSATVNREGISSLIRVHIPELQQFSETVASIHHKSHAITRMGMDFPFINVEVRLSILENTSFEPLKSIIHHVNDIGKELFLKMDEFVEAVIDLKSLTMVLLQVTPGGSGTNVDENEEMNADSEESNLNLANIEVKLEDTCDSDDECIESILPSDSCHSDSHPDFHESEEPSSSIKPNKPIDGSNQQTSSINPFNYYITPSMDTPEGRDSTRRCFKSRQACAKCGQFFLSRGSFSIHERTCKTDYKYACLYCAQVFTAQEKSKFRKHKDSHPEYSPKYQPTRYDTFDPKRDTKKKPFSCSVCNRKFSAEILMHGHMRAHPEMCFFQCAKCKIRCFNEQLLQSHLDRAHSTKDVSKCIVCSKICPSKSLLLQHYNKHHVPTFPSECAECGKKFSTPFRLHKHRQYSHANDMRFVCSECGKVLRNTNTYRQHMVLHSAVRRPYVCEVCGSAFSQQGSLKGHVRKMHEDGERSFKCSVCSAAFSQSSGLEAHKRRLHHTEVLC